MNLTASKPIQRNLLPQTSCRLCQATLSRTFVDLGSSPLCQRHIEPESLNAMEPFYPLHAFVCDTCSLVQLGEYVSPSNIFSNYAYFSSFSTSWLRHAKGYTDFMHQYLGLKPGSRVVEIASNDGYLLQYFVEKGVQVLGVEPAQNVASAALAKGIPTISKFFGKETAVDIRQDYGPADLLLGNNVLAHVPNPHDFVAGMKVLLADRGVITMEFPHLLELIKHNQFDTIYHEHFSYFSFLTAARLFTSHGLTLYDVEQLPTHGGSLRIFARHEEDSSRPITFAVAKLQELEDDFALTSPDTHSAFQERVKKTKRDLLSFLVTAKDAGKSVVGYGAPGKGNTLLNYCGVRTDFLDYTVDLSPHKQGRFLPGSRIPIFHPDHIRVTKPDYVVVLPWNLEAEIVEQMSYIRDWGGRFVVPIPTLAVR